MNDATLSFFWQMPRRKEQSSTTPSPKRAAPVFIGDAVQPWGGETMLLVLLRAERDEDSTGIG